MTFGWTHDIDALAQNGIIDYDAAAHLLGGRARFAGTNPRYVAPLQLQPQQPDKFVNSNKTGLDAPLWKKVLTAVLVTGLTIFAGFKLSKGIGKIVQFCSARSRKPTPTAHANAIVKLLTKKP